MPASIGTASGTGKVLGMSFEEILEELPKLTADKKERLRQLLDYQLSWTEAEEQAIDEGVRSRARPRKANTS